MTQGPLRSFDVFDTAVTRVFATPDDLHVELGRRLQAEDVVASGGEFVAARRRAETAAWTRRAWRGAIDIESVYELLAADLGWAVATRERAMQAEIDLEIAAARGVAGIAALIARHRAAGAGICFVSDMYLREPHIRSMLERLRLCEPGDRVFVSSEWGATKSRRGGLFRIVCRELKVWPWRIVHTGDDRRADVRAARLSLLRARHFPSARPTPAECLLLAQVAPDDTALRRVAVASKLARLSPAAPGAVPHATWVRLCDTIAPFVVAYAAWLIRTAAADGVTKLFFLARDMQVVCEVAQRLAAWSGAAVQCTYVHASRAAWQPAALDPGGDLFMLTDQLPRRTVRAALARLFDDADMAELAAADLTAADAPDERLPASLRALLATAPARAVAERAVARRRRLLLDYLRSNGFERGPACALVDAGWRGSLQRALAAAVAAEGGREPVRGYYIGLQDAAAGGARCPARTFLDAAVTRRLGYSLVSLVEAFLAADHGTTLGYRRDGGGVVPVLAAPPAPVLVAQVGAVRSACRALLDELETLVPATRVADLPELLVQPFLALCSRPRRDDARAFRGWLFDAGREAPRLLPIAAPPGVKDLLKVVANALRGRGESDLYLAGPWARGSIALAAPGFAWLFRRVLPPVGGAGENGGGA